MASGFTQADHHIESLATQLRAVEMRPNEKITLYNLGKSYLGLSMKEEAMKTF